MRCLSRDKRSEGHGGQPHHGQQGRGRGCGQGKGGARGGRWHACPHPGMEETRHHAMRTQEAVPAAPTQSNQAAGFCPLCRNHCSLSDPGCPKGEAYAASSSGAGTGVGR